jgi:hypothetical protein
VGRHLAARGPRFLGPPEQPQRLAAVGLHKRRSLRTGGEGTVRFRQHARRIPGGYGMVNMKTASAILT